MNVQTAAFHGTQQMMLIIAPYLGPGILSTKNEEELDEALQIPDLREKRVAVQAVIKATLELVK